MIHFLILISPVSVEQKSYSEVQSVTPVLLIYNPNNWYHRYPIKSTYPEGYFCLFPYFNQCPVYKIC